jgi:hypothetical protein
VRALGRHCCCVCASGPVVCTAWLSVALSVVGGGVWVSVCV